MTPTRGPLKRVVRGEWFVGIAAEEPLAAEPAGIYEHDDGRPLLGRKLAGRSQRELHDLGLHVEVTDQPVVIGTEAVTTKGR